MYRYSIIKGKSILPDGCNYLTYGIVVSAIQGKTVQEITRISDVTLNETQLISLIDRCNQLNLSPIHLKDIIDDFILSA